MKVAKIIGREILDSRGNPTVEAEIHLDNGMRMLAASPSGKSTGTHEAHELRDGDKERFAGKGVLKAVENVNNVISPALVGMDPLNQLAVDKKLLELDGTENKEKLGANAILAASLAVAKAGAYGAKLPLYRHIAALANIKDVRMPVAMFNVINGGEHADNNLDIQEFMIVPTVADTFRERLRAAAEHFARLHNYLRNKGYTTGVGDEGGFAPNLPSDSDAIDALRDTGNVKLAFDFAGARPHDINYSQLLNNGDVLSLEDPEGEDDWPAWQKLTSNYGDRVMIVGDDLFVTNVKRVQKGIDEHVANAVLIKPNQVGTLTETLEVIKLAYKNNYKVVVSHRSGETEDTFIADLAVGVGANYIKDGAPNRGERVAKYNRLLRIEEELLGK